MLVPDDHVAIALDSKLPDASTVLAALLPSVRQAIGQESEISVVATPGGHPGLAEGLPAGINVVVHDPEDKTQLAYLASSQAGRRIYLNRLLTDADAVIPVGEIGFDPAIGYRGPWSVLFPGLSNVETREDYAKLPPEPFRSPIDRDSLELMEESTEAGWLVGSHFAIGVVPGSSGFAEIVAGLSTSVRDQGIDILDRAWDFRADSQAELVVAGIGRPGSATTLDDLAAGIDAAVQLVQNGGKIVVLSRALGEIGPSLQRLIGAGDPRRGVAALRGHEGDEDYSVAARLNKAMAWADIYLLSALDPQVVEDLSMIPLGRAQEAARLVASSRSCIFLSHAELTRVGVVDDT